eukprot:2081178-Rhodomonas_salina.8
MACNAFASQRQCSANAKEREFERTRQEYPEQPASEREEGLLTYLCRTSLFEEAVADACGTCVLGAGEADPREARRVRGQSR